MICTPSEIVTILKDVTLATAAGVTAGVALRGLTTWRRQLTGQADFEAARTLARATYVLRNAIGYCRSPLILDSEYPSGYNRNAPTPRDRAMATLHVYDTRWTGVMTALKDFDTATLECEALWGTNVRVATSALQRCLTHLRIAIEQVVKDEHAGGITTKLHPTFMLQMNDNIADWKGQENELTRDITAAIEGIEAIVRPHLNRAP